MAMIDIGGFLATPTVEGAVEYARTVEERGFDAVWAIDSQQLYTDAHLTLAACAEATDDLTLAPGVTNPTSRHPSVTANAAATLDQLAPGRVEVGLGAGDSAVYSIGESPANVRELERGASVVRDLLRGETVEFGGQPFTLGTRERDVPVHVAAEGPRTLRMAGSVGDGVIFGGGPKPATVRDLGLANVEEGADRSGRSLEDIELTVLAPACVDENRARAVERLKPVIEPIAYHNFSFSVEEAPPDVQEDLRGLVDAHDVREHGQEDPDDLERIPDGVWEYLGDRFAIAGTPDECRERLAALDDLGVDHVMCLFPPDPLGGAIEFHERVLSESVAAAV